jgi:MoxR-like ATPase
MPHDVLPDEGRDAINAVRAELRKVILGKDEVLERLLVALLADAHVLMEDVPGVGKTTLAKALARTFAGTFKRLQFTPDLLPTDVLGSSVYDPRDGSFTFKPGPIFANVLLADEINRASPRTQSSLLEAMSERQASIEGVTRALPKPFLVLATQNPIELHGTYPLPEAQLDRFGMRVELGYPSREREIDMLYAQADHHPVEDVEAVLDEPTLLALQRAVRAVRVDRKIGAYVVDLAEATRAHPSVKIGASPRASLALVSCSRARAYLEGRTYVVPEDVKGVAVEVFAHRLTLDPKSRYGGLRKEDVLREILGTVAVPV